jgi:hypothetical protein
LNTLESPYRIAYVKEARKAWNGIPDRISVLTSKCMKMDNENDLLQSHVLEKDETVCSLPYEHDNKCSHLECLDFSLTCEDNENNVGTKSNCKNNILI